LRIGIGNTYFRKTIYKVTSWGLWRVTQFFFSNLEQYIYNSMRDFDELIVYCLWRWANIKRKLKGRLVYKYYTRLIRYTILYLMTLYFDYPSLIHFNNSEKTRLILDLDTYNFQIKGWLKFEKEWSRHVGTDTEQ